MRMNQLVTGCLLLALSASALGLQGPPPDASQEESLPRGLLKKTEAASEGFTLFSPLRSQASLLVDLDGEVVHRWETDCAPGNSAYLQANGDLIRCGRMSNEIFRGGGQGGKIQRLSWYGELLWDLDLSTDEMLAHHDIAILPNGNILVIAWEYKSPAAAQAAGRNQAQISAAGFWPDMVLEYQFDEEGDASVVWEWHSFDHLIQDHDELVAHHGDVAAHPELIDVNGDQRANPGAGKLLAERNKKREERRKRELKERMRALGYTGADGEEERDPQADGPASGDWLHTNAIDYNAQHDLILLSVRTFSEVWVIDHSTSTAEAKTHQGGRYKRGGDLLYRFGNPKAFDHETNSPQRLFRQHDARWLGDTSQGLSVLVFNNGEGRSDNPFTTVDEFILPFDVETGFDSNRPELSWQYKSEDPTTFFASFVSGAQRLPNGNTLICNGVLGHLFEVDRAGSTVWEYRNPFVGVDPLEPKSAKPVAGQSNRPPSKNPKSMLRYGMFRATRISKTHPGLAGREL